MNTYFNRVRIEVFTAAITMKIEAAGSSEMFVNLPNYTATHPK
jgi:hypothetical protein